MGRASVIGMHFVCRDHKNVTDNPDGTFDTGFWAVDTGHCDGLEYVALHDSKSVASYRQGPVVTWRRIEYEGRTRVVFTVRDDGLPREWRGGGSGEKGYARAG